MTIHRDIDAELRFHFEARIEELVEQGMTREAARAHAHTEFGDLEATRASLREIDRRVAKRRNRAEILDALMQDLRYSARSLRRAPAVSLTIILTLALGIGVNAAMFSLLDAIYFRPPAGVVDPESIRRVWVERRTPEGPAFMAIFDYASYAAVARALESRAEATIFTMPKKQPIGRGENVPTVREGGIGPNFFSMLGVKPAIGRFFSKEEAEISRTDPVAVISEAFWKRHYDADPAVVGKELTLGRTKYTIIGVAGAGFRGIELDATDVWLPLGSHVLLDDGPRKTPWWQNANVNGFRIALRTGERVQDEELVQRVTQALRSPGIWFRQDTLAVSALGAINAARGPARISTEMQVTVRLVGVGLIVLLIAVANVINLLLARAVNRRREIAVRLALGISRSRLVRLLVTESTLLALLAAGAAIAAATWGGTVVRTLLMPNVAWASPTLHWRVLAFALFVAALVGAAAGLVPAFHSAAPNLTDGLKAGARNAGLHRSRLRALLVVAQAALSVVLLIGAVLFIRSLHNVKARDVGFDVDRLAFAGATYDTRDAKRDSGYLDRLRALAPRVEAIPGVERIAFTSLRPKWGMSFVDYYADGGAKVAKPLDVVATSVSRGYFATTGTKLLRGTTFDDASIGDGAMKVVINQQLAEQLWPNQDPLGRCLRFDKPAAPCATVIGVVQPTIVHMLDESAFGQVYFAIDHPPTRIWNQYQIIARADPRRLAAVQSAMRDLVRKEFPGAIPDIATMTQAMESEYRPWALGARLFTAFGVLALIVAAIGVYSTVSYAVNQRTHEFGVRIALGAQAHDLRGQVIGEGLRTTLIGIAAGIMLALAGGRLVASLLYGVAPTDPLSIVIVSAILVAIAIAAALMPARRATRADPISALRAD